ncbi:hypothetical protein OM076_42530 [Solirubrobacter ginsenosidimutans]|uniref:Uncharacterized protein n=1 Tax=Solirubrobacter ginsenosidimutans TaxID=490573 RepID=A0A9X3N1Y7_9ACTN|nr:hypothetical protein [Solirubrobacter ginsenosidimutans]MDA0167014.1 hypothetical protein [Solirubrobacter ginsenosidimutans]
MKWAVFSALVCLVVAGWFLAIRSPEETAPFHFIESATSGGNVREGGGTMPPAFRSNPRSIRVKGNVVSVLVHCNRVATCDGYAELDSIRTGALLGIRDYHLKAGADTRVRIPVLPGMREKRVRLSWQQDVSGWSGGWYDLTLHRR